MPTSMCVCMCASVCALVSRQIKSEELAKTLPAEASSVPHAHISYTLLMGGYLRIVVVFGYRMLCASIRKNMLFIG